MRYCSMPVDCKEEDKTPGEERSLIPFLNATKSTKTVFNKEIFLKTFKPISVIQKRDKGE